MSKKGRVFSGARPTGRQHLGNYLGAIQNYVALQDDYDCVYCIVDVHALTTVDTTQELRQNTFEMAIDWLAASFAFLLEKKENWRLLWWLFLQRFCSGRLCTT